MQSNREYTFDYLRSMSMIMVILIHVANIYSRDFDIISNTSFLFSLIYNTISRISVPLFFMISGALLLDRKFDKDKYLKRIYKYLLLIVAWDIIYLLWEYFFLGITYDNLFLLLIKPYRAHLWFLYTIFIIYLLQPFIKLFLDKLSRNFKIFFFILWLILSTLSMYNSLISGGFTIFSDIGYFVIGKYLYDFLKKQDLTKYNFIIIIMFIFSVAASIFLNYKASLQFNMFYNMFFAYRTPYIILSSFLIFILFYNLFHLKKPSKIILLLSDLSLGIYLIHGIFLDITSQMFNYDNINALFGIPLFSFLILLCSAGTVYLLKKNNVISKIL